MAKNKPETVAKTGFEYRFAHPVIGYTPGAHRSKSTGTGDHFTSFANLLDHPELRNLDVRATLRDNLGQTPYRWLVRRYQQRSAITLSVLGDVSESVMSSGGRDRLANLMAMVSNAALTYGDRFAFTGFDAKWRRELTIMPTKQRQFAHVFPENLASLSPPVEAGVAGMRDAVESIPQQPALVFWVSDFCFDIAETESALRNLSHHMVVPIVWQNSAANNIPSHAGWTEVIDPETGARRSLWMRKKFKDHWQKAMDDHFEALEGCFNRYRIKPIFVKGDITPTQLTEYFSGIYRNTSYVKK